jgi:hypothetical protein
MAPAGPAAEQNCPGTTFVHPDFDMIVQLRRSAGWAGQRGALIGEAVDQHVYNRARNFLRKRHKVQGRGTGHTVSKLAAIAIPTPYLGVLLERSQFRFLTTNRKKILGKNIGQIHSAAFIAVR